MMMFGYFTPFIEDYIQLMEKNDHFVFKCSYDTLGKDFANKLNLPIDLFVYFYILLKDAKETYNRSESLPFEMQEVERNERLKS